MHRLMRLTALALTGVLAFAAQAATETYDDIGEARTTATPGFWDLTDHAGVSVEVATETVPVLSVGDRSTDGAAFGEESDLFVPYSFFSLWSLARPLDSRPPQGLLLFFR